MRTLPKLLSKTKLLRGYRCLKSIYYTIHNPEFEPEISAAQQQIFDQGNEVGIKAREYYPGGILVDCKPWEFVSSLRRTRELLHSGAEHIFEAAFEYKGCYARADILKFNKLTQRWTLLEVKSATKIKAEHLDDIGLQAWIIANSGIKLERICVIHLNSDCQYPDLSNLFVEEDVTDRLRENYTSISPRLNEIFRTLRNPQTPDIDIGPQCMSYQRECEFKNQCWKEHDVPEISIFNIPKLNNQVWEFYRKDQIRLEKLDLDLFDETQRRMIEAHLSGKRFINQQGLQSALKDWEFPLIFLDFETINPAIPKFKGCHPYQHVPFQFSVHVLSSRHASLEHYEFLHNENSDPRPTLIPKLLDACGTHGTVVAYYAKFEKDCLQGLAEAFTPYRNDLLALASRLKDPLPILRENFYDPQFRLSYSLKSVAPALLGEEFSYLQLAISDGAAAQRAYAQMLSEDSPKVREEIRRDMLEYCQKDTLALVRIVRWLLGLNDN